MHAAVQSVIDRFQAPRPEAIIAEALLDEQEAGKSSISSMTQDATFRVTPSFAARVARPSRH